MIFNQPIVNHITIYRFIILRFNICNPTETTQEKLIRFKIIHKKSQISNQISPAELNSYEKQ